MIFPCVFLFSNLQEIVVGSAAVTLQCKYSVENVSYCSMVLSTEIKMSIKVSPAALAVIYAVSMERNRLLILIYLFWLLFISLQSC